MDLLDGAASWELLGWDPPRTRMTFDGGRQVFDITHAEERGARLGAVKLLWRHGRLRPKLALRPELALPPECRELAPSAQQAYLASGLTPLLWDSLLIASVTPSLMHKFGAQVRRVHPHLRSRPVPREVFEHVPQLPELHHLTVEYDEFTDEDVDRLAPLGALEQLRLHSKRLTDACLPTISRLRSLRFLDLQGSPQISRSALKEATHSLPNLMRLSLPRES